MLGWLRAAAALASWIEALPLLLVGAELRRQELQRHLAIELGVLGEKDFAHAPAADLFSYPVMRNGFADHTSL